MKGVVFLTDKQLLDLRIRTRDFDLFIGIDPGVETGYAEYHKPTKKILRVNTLQIHRAFAAIDFEIGRKHKDRILVRVEDARLRQWIPKERGREVLQNVGSVKRDCKIWEDFLTDRGLAFELLPPAAGRTKWSADYFKKLTGYTSRTSNHGRDAAALVYGL